MIFPGFPGVLSFSRFSRSSGNPDPRRGLHPGRGVRQTPEIHGKLWDMVNKQSVCILLECILVTLSFDHVHLILEGGAVGVGVVAGGGGVGSPSFLLIIPTCPLLLYCLTPNMEVTRKYSSKMHTTRFDGHH